MLGRGARIWLAAVLIVVFSLLGGATTSSAKVRPKKPQGTTRPNIIVVMTDDMRQDDMLVMKNVKSLIGAQGVTFDNSIVSFPLCCPSRATFLTGQYAHNHGVMGNHAPQGGYSNLQHSNTLAVWLQRAGYATIHLGKYLNDYGRAGNDPTEVPPGWTEWHGAIAVGYSSGTMNVNGTVTRVERGHPGGLYTTDLYSDRAVEIVQRRARSPKPFFLWVAYVAPHSGNPKEAGDPPDIPTPAVAPRHRDAFATLPAKRLPSHNAPTPVQSRKPLTDTQIAQIDEAYRQRLESLLAVDEGVARIIGALPRAERANTIVVFTSDNGYFLGEHRFPSGKGWPYEEAIRVPLLIRGPEVRKGVHVESLVANIDLAPTILALARAKPGVAQDGQSLVGFLRSANTAWNRAYLIESLPDAAGAPFALGVRTRRYLYVEYRGSPQGELYDLAVDPYELVSHWKNPAYAGLKAQLGAKVRALSLCRGSACNVSGS